MVEHLTGLNACAEQPVPGTCCLVTSYSFMMGSIEEPVMSITIALICFAYISYFLYRLAYWRGRRIAAYQESIIIAVAAFTSMGLVMVLPHSASESFGSTWDVITNCAFVLALALFGFMEVRLAVFLFDPRDDDGTMRAARLGGNVYAAEDLQSRRGLRFSIIVSLPFFLIGAGGIVLDHHWSFASAAEAVLLILFGLGLCPPVTRALGLVPRPMAKPWIVGVLLIHGGCGLNYFLMAAAPVTEWAMCTYVGSKIIFLGSFGPIFEYVLRNDRKFLRMRMQRLLQDGESDDEEMDRALDLNADSYKPPVLDNVPSFTDKDLVMADKIGSGMFGDVFRATLHGQDVAVKKFRLVANTPRDKARLLDAISREIQLLARLQHENVLGLLAINCEDESNILMATDLMDNGSVFDALATRKFSEHEKMHILRGMAAGLAYLHAQQPPVMHRDLKSHNVLLDSKLNAKLADFGLSRTKELTATMTACGTTQWMAPEILRGSRYSEKADIFAFGVVMWEVATGRRPFPNLQPMAVANLVANDNLRLPLPDSLAPAFSALISDCWHEDPRKRPSVDELVHRLGSLAATKF